MEETTAKKKYLTIYEMYMANDFKFGFYVHKDSWQPSRYAKVVAIEWVTEGKPIKGEPPYFGGFLNPPGHPRAGKKMGPRSVTLEADWYRGGQDVILTGGNGGWTRVYPENPKF